MAADALLVATRLETSGDRSVGIGGDTTAIELVHVDAHCIVALKPSGLPSVPGRGPALQDCVHARVLQHHDDARVVHRLDMATSGLIVFARGAEAQRRLSRAFAERAVEKRYVAVVSGRVCPPGGRIELPLGADWPNRPRQKVDLEHGKPCLTRYRVLAHDRNADTTRLELQPVTGRSHQLRLHLQAIGHPILGDALYAPEPTRSRAARLMLHAQRLSFPHPASGAALCCDAAVPF
jgi:tRNA pseudouridine32 synthase/23S rRNA pseudouridine746 synthase